jgi:hypothetical protein
VGALVVAISARLDRRRHRNEKTTVTVYGPDGAPLKTVEVPRTRHSRDD